MTLVFLLIGAVLMFGAGELYAVYRDTDDRKALWMCIAGVFISILNLLSAIGATQ